jgi:hypothetical protein
MRWEKRNGRKKNDNEILFYLGVVWMSLYAAILDVMTNKSSRDRWVGYKELRHLCEGQQDYGSNIPRKAFIEIANSVEMLKHKGIIFHKWRCDSNNEKKAITFNDETIERYLLMKNQRNEDD